MYCMPRLWLVTGGPAMSRTVRNRWWKDESGNSYPAYHATMDYNCKQACCSQKFVRKLYTARANERRAAINEQLDSFGIG